MKTVKILKPNVLKVILTEGKKRELRRLCGGLGYGVIRLKRTKYAFLTIKGLKEGVYRELTNKEITKLKTL